MNTFLVPDAIRRFHAEHPGMTITLVPTLARDAIRSPHLLRPTTPRLPSHRLYAAVPRPPFRTPPADAMLALLSRLASTVDRPSA